MTANDDPLLEVSDLSIEFVGGGERVHAVNDVSFSIGPRETLAVIGESGSGKSVTAMSIMGLLDPNRTDITGQIELSGVDLRPLTRAERRHHQGTRIGMIFQDALTALNPVQTVGAQIAEVYRVHERVSKKEAKKRAVAMMARVKIPAAEERYGSFPHQLSGGMRQRIMVAMALALSPDLLIADEPTTALDVTVQAQIIDLLTELRDELGMSMLFITHDLRLSAELADRIAVMYGGRIVESGAAESIYRASAHPYTRGLLRSIPRAADRGRRLQPIAGSPPNLRDLPAGCAFQPRCPHAADKCVSTPPEMTTLTGERFSRCHFAEELDND